MYFKVQGLRNRKGAYRLFSIRTVQCKYNTMEFEWKKKAHFHIQSNSIVVIVGNFIVGNVKFNIQSTTSRGFCYLVRPIDWGLLKIGLFD